MLPLPPLPKLYKIITSCDSAEFNQLLMVAIQEKWTPFEPLSVTALHAPPVTRYTQMMCKGAQLQ